MRRSTTSKVFRPGGTASPTRRPGGGRRWAHSAPRLLLVGTPGTGKRPVGAHLADERGFVHLDFEHEAVRDSLLETTEADLPDRLSAIAADRGIVITWGAGSPTQLRELERLGRHGFELIWFDGDRGAAVGAHYGEAPLPRFLFVDSFELDGRFRPVEAVVGELLDAPARVRSRAMRPFPAVRIATMSLRIAGGLALAAGTAFATVAALSGGRPAARTATASAVAVPHVAALPHQGILVTGRSLAGVHLGDSTATVRALWGAHFTRCPGYGQAMWCYLYPPPADPVGAGVQFAGNKVVAVFTLGSPIGWHTSAGLRIGQTLANPNAGPGDGTTWLSCAGYSAKATPTGANAVTSILTQGASVYGFALTRPSVSPCM